jgi:hypothetical protein
MFASRNAVRAPPAIALRNAGRDLHGCLLSLMEKPAEAGV